MTRAFWTACGVAMMLMLLLAGVGIVVFLWLWEQWDRVTGRT